MRKATFKESESIKEQQNRGDKSALLSTVSPSMLPHYFNNQSLLGLVFGKVSVALLVKRIPDLLICRWIQGPAIGKKFPQVLVGWTII